jgi:hypothetical protein
LRGQSALLGKVAALPFAIQNERTTNKRRFEQLDRAACRFVPAEIVDRSVMRFDSRCIFVRTAPNAPRFGACSTDGTVVSVFSEALSERPVGRRP